MTDNATLSARSRAHVWHPCTQMKDHEWLPLVPISKAEGVWLEDFEGKRYLDAVSSWWTNIFGHRHPHIVERMKAQLDTLECHPDWYRRQLADIEGDEPAWIYLMEDEAQCAAIRGDPTRFPAVAVPGDWRSHLGD